MSAGGVSRSAHSSRSSSSSSSSSAGPAVKPVLPAGEDETDSKLPNMVEVAADMVATDPRAQDAEEKVLPAMLSAMSRWHEDVSRYLSRLSRSSRLSESEVMVCRARYFDAMIARNLRDLRSDFIHQRAAFDPRDVDDLHYIDPQWAWQSSSSTAATSKSSRLARASRVVAKKVKRRRSRHSASSSSSSPHSLANLFSV